MGKRYGTAIQKFYLSDGYGAVLDGVANDSAAFVAAIAAISAAGGGHLVIPDGVTVNLGSLAGGATLASVSGLTHFGIVSNGSRLNINTTSGGISYIVRVTNTPNTYWDGVRVVDAGFDPTATWRGVTFAHVRTTGNGAYYDSHYLGPGLKFENCVQGVFFENSDLGTSRIRGIRYDGPRADHCYYGVAQGNTGDDSTGVYYTDTCHRPIIAYGCSGLSIEIIDQHDGNANYGNAGSVIGVVTNGFNFTKNKITLRASGTEPAAHTQISLDDQTASAGVSSGIIRDLDITLDLSELTPAGATPFRFRAPNVAAGACDTVWDNIVIRGDGGGYANNISGWQFFQFTNWPNVEGKLSIGPDLVNALTYQPMHFPGFAVKTTANTEVRTKSGNLTSGSIVIPLDVYNGRAFYLRVRAVMEADATSTTGAKAVHEQLIQGYRAYGGNVTILQNDATSNNFFRTTDCVMTATASGTTIALTFTNYNGANAFANVAVEHMSKLT